MSRIFLIFCLLIWISPGMAQNRLLADCRAIQDVNERVACYDAIVDAAQLSVPAETAQPSPTQRSATEEPVSARPVEEPRAQSTATSRPSQQEQDFGRTREELRQEPESIQSAVRAVSSSAFGKIVVELENGHTWQQVDSNRLRLRDGDQVIIRGGTMGAYFLEKTEGSRSIRVRRVL